MHATIYVMASAVFETASIPVQYSQESGMIFLSSWSFWASLQVNSRAYFMKKTDKRTLYTCKYCWMLLHARMMHQLQMRIGGTMYPN